MSWEYTTLEDYVGEAAEYAALGRIPTGFPFFDKRIGGGVTQGEVTLMLARTSVGKTWWLANVIANNPGIPAIFFSIEMAGRAMAIRLAAITTDTPDAEIKHQLEEQGYSSALDKLPDLLPKLTLVDDSGITLRKMSTIINEVEDRTGERPRFVGIDYLELVSGAPGMEAASQVSDLSKDIKRWARRMDVHVFVLHQVPRGRMGQKDGKPLQNDGHMPLTLQSGKYGGEEAADYVLGAYRPHLDPELTFDQMEFHKGEFFMQFLKTRGGDQTHPQGVEHRINTRSGRIRPLKRSDNYNQEAF